MAKSSRRVSAQEATIQQQDESITIESHHSECPICIDKYNEPFVTSCGHRFCKKCISSWFKKGNTCCPIDNKLLIECEMFLDKIVRRGLRQTCSNALLKCHENHKLSSNQLTSAVESRQFICPFKACGCSFESNDSTSIDAHSAKETSSHLGMLMSTLAQNQLLHYNNEANTKAWEKISTSTGDSKVIEQLLKSLHDRISVLEQKNREKDEKIERLTNQIAKAYVATDVQGRHSNGVLVWSISQFQNKVRAMSADPNRMFYGPDAYTSPHGYKFCARINISPKVKDAIGLHVHLMQSENDFHLDWPFRGRIKISMIHTNLSETKHDTIMSKPEILAFHRPTQNVSPRGFGFIEYAIISDIQSLGFVVGDTLTLKIQLSIV